MNGVFVTRLEALLNATARVQSVVDCFSWPDDFRVVLRQEWSRADLRISASVASWTDESLWCATDQKLAGTTGHATSCTEIPYTDVR
jgi:hypothetical protein